MTIAQATNADLRIVPLELADVSGIDELLEEQRTEWIDLLKWDYSGPSQVIRQVIRERELPGFVAMSGKKIIGLAYYVVDGSRCSIGDVYVSKSWRGRAADQQMMAAMLDSIERAPGISRIESQCVGVDNDGSNRLLAHRGFNRLTRLFMMHSVAEADTKTGSSPSGVTIRAWRPDDFSEAVRVIHRSYRGQPDSLINSQYKTEAGCAELLTILTDHIWCGQFMPQASLAAEYARRTGTRDIAGVLIASRIAQGTGHIGQISVRPSRQGVGIGRALIANSLTEFARLGFAHVSLAVTSSNENALRLYESCGFQTVHEFSVFYRGRS